MQFHSPMDSPPRLAEARRLLRRAGHERTRVARRARAWLKKGAAPLKRLRLYAKQQEFGAAPGRQLSLQGNWAGQWQLRCLLEFRLCWAAVVYLIHRRGVPVDGAGRALQGLASKIPIAVLQTTGFRTKWGQVLSATALQRRQMRIPVESVSKLAEDIFAVSHVAFAWHRASRMLWCAEELKVYCRFRSAGQYQDSISVLENMLPQLQEAELFQNFDNVAIRLFSWYFELLRFDDAEAFAQSLLSYDCLEIRNRWRAGACLAIERVQRERLRGFHPNTNVRVCEYDRSLDGKLCKILGRPREEMMHYWFREEADIYEVILEKTVYQIHRKHLCLVKTAVQLSVQEAGDTLHVTGILMSGAPCARFSVALAAQHSPARLREQTAIAMDVPVSNIVCILPSGALLE